MAALIDDLPAQGHERRAFTAAEFRQVDDERRTAWVTVCRYNMTDDYQSVWNPGCFAESLERKKPKVTGSHNWNDVIGRVIDYRDSPEKLDCLIQFSDFSAVPNARKYWAQMRDGDIDEMSFGFERRDVQILEDDPNGAVERIMKADLYEVSPVLVGAVPGTGVISVRNKLRSILTDEQIIELRELLTEEAEVTAKPETKEEEPEELLREPGDTGEPDELSLKEAEEKIQEKVDEEAKKINLVLNLLRRNHNRSSPNSSASFSC